MAAYKAGRLSELPAGSMREMVVDGRPVALCNVGGELHAIEGECPHRNGPLAHGALHGTTVVCPWHAWEFDCVTGAYDYDPAVRLKKYAVRVEGGEILIETD